MTNKPLEYWENEININNFIKNNKEYMRDDPIQIPIKKSQNIILLTGATGFLGAYMLALLVVKDSIETVYCLSRNKHKLLDINDTIFNNLKHHQLYEKLNPSHLSKIKAVCGDLSKDNLGMSDLDYNMISSQCNLIIHSGADINLRAKYEILKNNNCKGVKEIINLSISNLKKEGEKTIPIGIVFVSTYGVYIRQDPVQEFDEQKVGLVKLKNIETAKNGYIQSKIVSEHILTQSSNLKSIPYMILRVPSIFSHPETGIGHDFDLVQIYYKTVYEVKQTAILQTHMLLSPITWVADNCVALIFNNHDQNGWLKLNQNRSHLNAYNVTGDVIHINDVFNNQFKSIDFNDWKSMVSKSNGYFSKVIKNPNSFNPVNSLRLSAGYNSSYKTKQLLKSIGTYGDGGVINLDMVIKIYNRSVLKSKL